MMFLPGGVFVFFMAMMAIGIAALVFWIIALVEVLRTPEPAFGPPWDNCRNAWLIGIVVGFFLPAGEIVVAVLWWTQGRKALRAGAVVPRPFWAPAPKAYYPLPPQQPYPPQPPYGG